METTAILDDTGNPPDVGLSPQIIRFLDETRKWAKFLSIVGFIFVGLLVLLALFIGTILGTLASFAPEVMGFPSAFITIFYLLIALLYFFPVLYLYKFSDKMGKAIQNKDNVLLTAAFENLKSHYKFIGILVIVFLSFYILIMLFAIIGALSM